MKVFSRVEISLLFYGFKLDWGAHWKFFLFFKVDAVLHLSLDNSWLGAKLNLVFIVLVIVEKFDQRVLHLDHAAQYHSKVDMELVRVDKSRFVLWAWNQVVDQQVDSPKILFYPLDLHQLVQQIIFDVLLCYTGLLFLLDLV